MTPISFRESQKIVAERASALHTSREKINTRNAIHRVLAESVYSHCSNPSSEVAAMDGIAIDATKVQSRFSASEWQRINTGDIVAPPWNTVVKIEDVEFDGETAIVSSSIVPMQNVRIKGEDFGEGSLLFTANHFLTAPDLSLLLAAGHGTVEVLKKPVITFIPTGSELIQENKIESNSAMVAALIESWGGNFKLADPVPDDHAALKQAIREAIASSEIVVVSAGTSMGTRDITASMVRELGTLWFHGVAVQPAKPVLMGQIGDVPVIGLPGYPASAYIASIYFVQPLVRALSGVENRPRREVHISAEEIPARNTDSIYRVNLFDVDGRIYVRKIPRGAGSVLSLSRMDGLMHVPPNTAIHKRDGVRIDLVQDRSANTIAIRGVTDQALERLWDLFKNAMPSHRILFWPSNGEEALESIIERNSHIAIINTFPDYDLFPDFARQLQENMLRYRILSRTIGVVVADSSTLNSVHDLPNDFVVSVPEKNLHLWPKSCTLKQIPIHLSDEAVLRWIKTQPNTGAFVDIRFLKTNEKVFFETQEHFDLIVSESYSELPPIKKLIDLLLSPQYGEWILSFRGCDPGSRGFLHETFDVL
jgi:putative molybdopterin biosynthesis protein